MFGLEQGKGKGKGKRDLFEFDLEKDLKNDPKKAQAISNQIDEKVKWLKEELRKGTATEDFETCGTLLHGYVAMQKVINRVEQRGK